MIFLRRTVGGIILLWLAVSLFLSLCAAGSTVLKIIRKDTPAVTGLGNYSSTSSIEIYASDNTTLLYNYIYYYGGHLSDGEDMDLAVKVIDALRAKQYTNKVYPFWYKMLLKYNGIDPGDTSGFVMEYYFKSLINVSGYSENKEDILRLYTSKRLKREYSKEELYRLFLDSVHYAQNIHGISGAARAYFGKEYKELSPLELAYLIALVGTGGGAYTDYDKLARQIIYDLYVSGELSPTQYRQELGKRLDVRSDFRQPFMDATVNYIVRECEENYPGIKAGTGRLKIYTHYNTQAVKLAYNVLSEEFAKDSKLQGAFVMVNTETLGIEAAVGSRFTSSHNNRALTLQRQLGSVFKPVVYTAAFEAGLSPAMMVEDKRYVFISGDTEYSPRNDSDRFYGFIPMRYGLVHSLNNATVLVAQTAGLQNVIDTAYSLGYNGETLLPVLSLSLGTFATTPVNVATMYTTLANYGRYGDLSFIRTVTLDDAELEPVGRDLRVTGISEESAFQTMYIMQDVAKSGTAKKAGLLEGTASKTGTTDKWRDYWFVAITPPYVTVIWFGYDDNSSMEIKSSGGSMAAPAVAEFQKQYFGSDKTFEIIPPANIEFLPVDIKTGTVVETPDETTYTEAFNKLYNKPDDGDDASKSSDRIGATPENSANAGQDAK